jgi:hypothetical protein
MKLIFSPLIKEAGQAEPVDRQGLWTSSACLPKTEVLEQPQEKNKMFR